MQYIYCNYWEAFPWLVCQACQCRIRLSASIKYIKYIIECLQHIMTNKIILNWNRARGVKMMILQVTVEMSCDRKTLPERDTQRRGERGTRYLRVSFLLQNIISFILRISKEFTWSDLRQNRTDNTEAEVLESDIWLSSWEEFIFIITPVEIIDDSRHETVLRLRKMN